ncbi:hypothetical protein HanPI659440_Chr07g0276801 [Helianthus annuus]|nr:hypothetical protein HanPI659440_Chr07g0276801 [Helianthus annuus]
MIYIKKFCSSMLSTPPHRFCHLNLTAYRLSLTAAIRNPAEVYIVNRSLGLLFRNGVKEFMINDSVEHYDQPN